MAQDREIVRALAQTGPVLVLVHNYVESPIQAVLDAPMLAHDRVQSVWRKCDAEQVISRLGRGFRWRFADSRDFADSGEPRLLMLVLQPADIGRDGRGSCLDAAVVGVYRRFGRDGLALGIIKIPAHVVVQTDLVSLQRRRVVAALFHDLFGYRALAIERIDGHDIFS